VDRIQYTFFLKKNRRRDPIAKALEFFIPKIIQDKTKYTRKLKHKTRIPSQ